MAEPVKCGCGCGDPAPIAPRTITSKGWVKGRPIRFIKNHHHRVRPVRSLAERLREKYTVQADGCWVWTGALDKNGYGQISVGGRGEGLKQAHVASWELVNGPVPEGLELDHLCRVRACVNPSHLEAVTHLVNVRRSRRWPRAAA